MLWADVKPHPEHRAMVYLFLGNAGPTVAHNVSLTIDPPIVPGQQPVRCIEAQREAARGVSAIPPNRTHEWALGVGHELISAPKQPKSFSLTITGRAGSGAALSETFTVPLDAIRHTSAAPGAMESMARSLDELVVGLNGKTSGQPIRAHIERIANKLTPTD